ncbi:MAG TPA: response regulator transcription factor [Myxococcota bacterium]|nr:response regulator transcription factor [Myxococcota bacterium]
MRVLLLEDDVETASALEKGLSLEGHRVFVAARAREALELVAAEAFDVAVLDVSVPDGSGYDVLAALRAEHRPTQVLMLTARGRVEDRVEGLDRGADDYLVKPFSFAELAARLRALDRRPKPVATELRSEALALDLIRRTASVGGERLDLTPTEFSLLAALLRERGAPISRRALLREVWGYEFDPGTNVVDVHVNRLRRKLEDRGLEDVIRTVRGSGYAVS